MGRSPAGFIRKFGVVTVYLCQIGMSIVRSIIHLSLKLYAGEREYVVQTALVQEP